QLTILVFLDGEALLMYRAMVASTHQDEIRHRGGTAVSPVTDVVTLPEPHSAAREAAAAVAMTERPPQRRRNRPRARPHLHDAPVRVVAHQYATRIAGDALRRSSWNASAFFEDGLPGRGGIGEDGFVDVDDHLKSIARRAGVELVAQSHFGQKLERIS